MEATHSKTTNHPSNTAAFIRIREVISSAPWGGWIKTDMPLELRHQYFMAFWPEARLRRHLEMLRAFGFNSIQINANPLVAWWVGADAKQWRQHLHFQCQTARELGLSISLFVWGAAVADASQEGQQFSELNWHAPDDRNRLEAWYRDQAEFAPYADRVITHWVDPGKLQEGGIDTVVEMHNVILGIYRQKNPRLRGALSTWFMQGQMGHPYSGYESPGQVAAHPRLDRDTDVVIGLMNYWSDGVNRDSCSTLKTADLAAIAAADRPAGVWGWYTADNEINPALHVRTAALQNYFRRLPAQSRTQLAWHSLDDCFSGLNMQNLYVAGKLMQDPALDAQRLLEEFCRGFVGDTNAPAVIAALRAVEQARTRSLLYAATAQGAVAPELQEQAERQPLPDSWLSDTAKAADSALVGLKSVKLVEDFQPAWPVDLAPQEYLIELQAHLEAIRQMLAFLNAAHAVEKMKPAGASVGKLTAAIDSLPSVVYDRAHTAGLEASIYPQKLAALRKAVLSP